MVGKAIRRTNGSIAKRLFAVPGGLAAACLLAPLLALTLTVFLAGCGSSDAGGAGSGSTAATAQYGPPTINVDDIRLIADFPNQILFTRGHRISFDALVMEGAAHIDPGEGLSVYKGGINEVVDPSFEGQGWQLGPGGSIDSSTASSGAHSLRITGNGSSELVARLKEPVPVVNPGARTVSFDYNVQQLLSGTIIVELKAMNQDGALVGRQSATIKGGAQGWQRDAAFIYVLPPDTTSYTMEINTDTFLGTVNLDAFLAEPKDFFTPYFDGDSDNCLWVGAATPQDFTGQRNTLTSTMMIKGGLVSLFTVAIMTMAVLIFVHGVFRRRLKLLLIPPLLGTPVAVLAMISLGVIGIPSFMPLRLTMPTSRLAPDQTYFYRVTSIDDQGRESPPSTEARLRTGWLERRLVLTWSKDPGAVKYRVYRGSESYAENTVFEVTGNLFVDLGDAGESKQPPLELGADTAAPHASRSLRPEPDTSISNTRIGLDTSSDFWVTGEVEFGFSSDNPFKPASLFEIGNPHSATQFAVSTRYFPEWGDEYPKILLIKGRDVSDFDSAVEQLPPIHPGSVIRYVAAQLYEPNGELPAGAHLWYRIDNGEVRHLQFANTERMSDWPLIKISKRYYYDEFGNNSTCRSFAIVQGQICSGQIDRIMSAGTVPDILGRMVILQ